jgi:hypothetical protein
LDWYAEYAKRHADDGAEGRLVTMHSFTRSWDMWEMHPEAAKWCCALPDRSSFISKWGTVR